MVIFGGRPTFPKVVTQINCLHDADGCVNSASTEIPDDGFDGTPDGSFTLLMYDRNMLKENVLRTEIHFFEVGSCIIYPSIFSHPFNTSFYTTSRLLFQSE